MYIGGIQVSYNTEYEGEEDTAAGCQCEEEKKA